MSQQADVKFRRQIIHVWALLNSLLSIFFVYHFFVKASTSHGDGMMLGYVFALTALPSFIASLLYAVVYTRHKSIMAFIMIPAVIFGVGILYDESQHIRNFEPINYQHLVGIKITDPQIIELFSKARGLTGSGTDTDESGVKHNYWVLPGMKLVVDESDTIIRVIDQDDPSIH